MLVIEVSTKPLLNLSLIGYFRVCWLSKITYKAKTDQGGRNENSKRGTVKLYQSKLRFWFFGFFLWQCQGLALRLVLLWQLLIRHRSGDCPHPAKLQRTEQNRPRARAKVSQRGQTAMQTDLITCPLQCVRNGAFPLQTAARGWLSCKTSKPHPQALLRQKESSMPVWWFRVHFRKTVKGVLILLLQINIVSQWTTRQLLFML